MDKGSLSVVIPTRNRQFYCLESVKHICSLGLNNLEVVIYDNSDDISLNDDISSIDPKGISILYFYDEEEISFSENFKRAINKASNEFICVIGDDDTVLENIMDVVSYMKSNKIESIISSNPINFSWPGANTEKGTLSLLNYKGRVQKINNKKGLFSLIENSFQDYNKPLPRLYHGIVKKSKLDEIKRQGLHVFGGISPDIYSTIILSLYIKKNYVLDFPFTIAGACPGSGSSDSSKGKHCGELKDAPHFKGIKNYKWPEILPKYYSVETVWAEAALQAFKDTKK